jgi:ABC-type glycerol-3-phosphate transport system permease component
LLYQPFQTPYGEVLAGATFLFVLPGLLVLFLQRYFVRSIATSGIAG